MRAARAEAEAALAERLKTFHAESRDLVGRIRTANGKRDGRVADVPKPLLARYDAIRKSKGELGISLLEGGICGACHTQLPLNLIHRVLEADSVDVCENCGRLLCAPFEATS